MPISKEGTSTSYALVIVAVDSLIADYFLDFRKLGQRRWWRWLHRRVEPTSIGCCRSHKTSQVLNFDELRATQRLASGRSQPRSAHVRSGWEANSRNQSDCGVGPSWTTFLQGSPGKKTYKHWRVRNWNCDWKYFCFSHLHLIQSHRSSRSYLDLRTSIQRWNGWLLRRPRIHSARMLHAIVFSQSSLSVFRRIDRRTKHVQLHEMFVVVVLHFQLLWSVQKKQPVSVWRWTVDRKLNGIVLLRSQPSVSVRSGLIEAAAFAIAILHKYI